MLNNEPTVSAVIIARNQQATVRRCIKSALAQTYSVGEIIVVDRNSTDHTSKYASDVARLYDEVEVIAEEPETSDTDECGPAVARNTGAALASGDLVLFLNADVAVEPDYVSRLIKLMRAQDLDAVSGLRWNIRNSLVSGLMNVHYALNYDVSDGRSGSAHRSPAFLSSDAMLIKSETFWDVGGYDAAMPAGEDADLGFRLHGAGYTIGHDRSATIWHEGRRHRSVADWFQQLKWYGRGAASLARTHTWRLERERSLLNRNIVLPASAILLFLLIAIVLGNIFGPLALAMGPIAFTVVGFKYMRSALAVQEKCEAAELPTPVLPVDIVLYPIFKAVRYAALSAFTWQALLDSAETEPLGRTEDGAL